MFKVKRRLKSVRDSKKQSRSSSEGSSDQSSSVSNQRGILKSDNSCRSNQSPNSLSLWTSNSSPNASAVEESSPHQIGTGSRSTSTPERADPVKPRRVQFDSVRIREYERALGDNPSCSSGAPITIGWAHGKESTVKINDYESVRDKRRNQGELTLSRVAREELLLEWGATFNEIIEAIRSNVRIKNQRRRTVNSIGTYDKWEEAMERAGRKIKKTLLPQKGSGSNKVYKNYIDQKKLRATSSDSPVSSLSSEPQAGNVVNTSDTSDDLSKATVRQLSISDVQRTGNRRENADIEHKAPIEVADESTPDTFSTTRPTPLIEIRTAPSCASAMSMLEDDFDEDGYDDFEDLLDPYITVEGDQMFPPVIHVANGCGDDDTGTLTGSYGGYSVYSAEDFEMLTRDHSHWKVESGSTNSGPKVERVFNPITIYEDESVGDPRPYQMSPNYHPIRPWQMAGFQVQPPPHSASLLSQWE